MARLIGVFSLLIALVAVPATAQTVANGPYYAMPSWDQKFPCATQANCPRFVVLANWSSEAVLDRETGLVWQRNPSSTVNTWPIAVMYACGLIGGRAGWRVATLAEIETLIALDDPAQFMATLPAGHPFGAMPADGFWTATTSVFDDTKALVWRDGWVSEQTKASQHHSAWCVRGPLGPVQ